MAKAGIRTHLVPQRIMLGKIMKSGEGAAVSKAGTATIPSVLRRTSRVIKNGL